jgi:hypothetical protein
VLTSGRTETSATRRFATPCCSVAERPARSRHCFVPRWVRLSLLAKALEGKCTNGEAAEDARFVRHPLCQGLVERSDGIQEVVVGQSGLGHLSKKVKVIV